MQHGKLPVGEESFFKFGLQIKNDLYMNYEQAFFCDPSKPDRFSYPADHPLTSEFEEQMVALLREYKGDVEYLSVDQLEEPNAKDVTLDSTAWALLAGATGSIGSIVMA